MANLFDRLFGRTTNQNAQQSTTQSTTAEKTQKQEADTEKAQVASGAQAVQQTTLSPEVQQLLTQFIGSGSLEQAGAGQTELAALLTERAAGADNAYASGIQSILNNARYQGEQELAGANTALAERTGSMDNTLSALIGQQGRNDLETKLGGLAGELGIQARQAGTEELTSALGGLGQTASNVAGIASVLKGAEVSGRTEEQTANYEAQTIQQFLEELTKGQTSSNATSTGKSSTGGNVLDVIKAIGSFTEGF